MTGAQIEAYLRKRVRAVGGQTWKWTGRTGEPDRVVILPGGHVVFVEVKGQGDRLSALQDYTHRTIRALGAEVCVVWSKEDVDRLLERFCPSKNERGMKRNGYERERGAGNSEGTQAV